MPVTFSEIEAVDNGAQFINADLHIHSFGGSHDVTDNTMTVEAIVDAAVKMGIRLLAITDHNNDANTEKSIAYAQKYTGQLLVLAGCEISTAHGHLLVYFAPTEADNLRNLLGKINIVGKLGDQNAHTAMSMTDVIKEAERLGGICVAAHVDRTKTGFETLATGYPNWKKDIVTSTGLYGMEFDDANNLRWYTDRDESTQDGAERAKLMSARANIPALAGRPLFAHVQGSDAHTLKDFSTNRGGKILTRFKLNELSFGAFRTALTDPDARVRPVASIPKSFPRILGMQVTGGFLDGETYHFSDNLNCFIGGRGTGKSSALQTLAHGLGLDDEMQSHDNCPGTVVVYCEDSNGIRYRYERVCGAEPIVKARNEGEIEDVPVDAFRVEYYRQGELAEVAKDPLQNPLLLQQFLDRHLVLSDLLENEKHLVTSLNQNSAQLIPVEVTANQLPAKQKSLEEVNKKLTIAEEGKLKDIAADQGRLTNEKNLSNAVGEIRDEYNRGITLSNFERNYVEFEKASTPLTGDADSDAALLKIKTSIEGVNAFLRTKQIEIQTKFNQSATEITTALAELKQAQSRIETALNSKVTELQKKGLSGNLAELQLLLKQKTSITTEINRINSQAAQLKALRSDRAAYLKQLADVRNEIFTRRKEQLKSINQNLAATIEDYTVFVHYDPSGITDKFKAFILEEMQGTYFPEETAKHFCSRMVPLALAKLILDQEFDLISAAGGIDKSWAEKMVGKLRFYEKLHKLEVMWKSPCPVITVKTKGAKPRSIPVNQLSDGQKHTIMLTVAMLAESNIPLVIDQPEDDLDNAFIFSAVVHALRSIKERRQVVLVTHNANIAVLGDAELLLPMRRQGDGGVSFDRGSIDKGLTKCAVLNILEGGSTAFRRRKEIYGH